MKKIKFTLGVILVVVGFAALLWSCNRPRIIKEDTYGVLFAETNWFQDNIEYSKVLELVANPSEDMIIYRNGIVIKTIIE